MLVKTESPVLPLLRTVFASILEVFLLCLAGYILAHRGILDKKTQRQLNRLNVSLFTPSLLFSKVAFFLSLAKLRELWIIPILFISVTLLSMGVAFTLGWIFKLKRSQRKFAMAASMFMNSNSLPIALMQSLIVTSPHLKWGKDDNKNAMVGRALTYLVMYSTLVMVLRWSYGVRLLAQADDEEPIIITAPEEEDERSLLLSDSQATLPGDDAPQARVISPTGFDTGGERRSNDILSPHHGRLRPKRRDTGVFLSFPNTPNRSAMNPAASTSSSTSNLSKITTRSPSSAIDVDGDEESEDEDTALPCHRRHPTEPTSSRFQSLVRRSLCRIGRWWATFNDFMKAPLWAAIASLIVAGILPLQHFLEEYAQPIKGSLASAGDCAVPVTLIVLGAYFYRPKEEGGTGKEQSFFTGIRNTLKLWRKDTTSMPEPTPVLRPGETRTVVIAILSRMVIVPMLLMPLMALSTTYKWQAVFEDPVFVVANVLLISSPPALTLAQSTQAVASGNAFERLISRTIFWSYCVVTPPATIIYVVIGMLLAKL
ncbi:hypothetical protein FIBSPDRAFT_957637 [Athelia psychrophila]|uniref:Auxin efflux carrier n=1 Tax=Athelia psychrophila TaxID=1759441 RepID=A0A166FLE9_9AGAM|nr:hypothetical protein FIBSPDRAFT_957637 [Fibularhizoctonia sp. CBS 109695]